MVFIIFLLIIMLALFVDAMVLFGWYKLHKLTTKYHDSVDRISKAIDELKKELDDLDKTLDEFLKDQA